MDNQWSLSFVLGTAGFALYAWRDGSVKHMGLCLNRHFTDLVGVHPAVVVKHSCAPLLQSLPLLPSLPISASSPYWGQSAAWKTVAAAEVEGVSLIDTIVCICSDPTEVQGTMLLVKQPLWNKPVPSLSLSLSLCHAHISLDSVCPLVLIL